MLQELEFTIDRRMARHWLVIALKAIWHGEYRVRLRVDGKSFRFMPAKRGFSSFIREASPEEKERVYKKVIDDANEAQRQQMKGGNDSE